MILNLVMALVGLLLLFGVFSMFETAFFSLSRARLKQITKSRPRHEVDHLAQMLARPQNLLTLVVVGITIADIAVATVGAVLFHHLLGGWMNPTAFLVVETLCVTLLVLIFGELAPKLFALAHSEAVALRLAPFMSFAGRFLGPITRPIARGLSLETFFERRGGDMVTVEELKSIVEAGSREGAIAPEETQLLRGAIRIGEVAVREILVPREDMVAVEVDATSDEAVELVRETWHSRVPVYQGTLQRVVGIVHAKDLLPFLDHGGAPVAVREIMREATYVTASRPMDEVLAEMQRARSQIAVVTDPEGQALGIVTLEDVLEQLVGGLQVEYEAQAPAVELLEGGDAMVQGRVHVRDANRLLGVELPVDRGRTVAELLRHLIPGPPTEGESVRLGPVELVLESVVGGQIRGVRVVRAA